MKTKQFYFMIAVLVAILFSACSMNEEIQQNKALSLSGIINNIEPVVMDTRGVMLTTASLNPDSVIESTYTLFGTRTPVNDANWQGIDGYRDIAVMVGGDVYKYSVDAHGNLTSSDPYVFTTANDMTVSSWYPYSSSLNSFTVQANQSNIINLQNSDYLYGSSSTINIGSNNSIIYKHKTARVIIKVVANNANYMLNKGIVDAVSFSGAKLSCTVNSIGDLAVNGNNTNIPINMYRLSSSTVGTVTTSYFVAQIPPQRAALNIVLSIGHMKYTALMPSAENFAAGVGNEITVNINSSRVYISSGNTISAGDYYCNSNSGQAWVVKSEDLYSAKSNWGATPIAVIFSDTTSVTDQNHGWRLGYAMALQCATTDLGEDSVANWGPSDVDTPIPNASGDYRTWKNNWDGYTETHLIGNNTDYPAFYYALNYNNTIAAPNLSSKWYLPSNGQWMLIVEKLGGLSSTSFTYYEYHTSPDYFNMIGWKKDDESYSTACQNSINAYLYAVQNYAPIYIISHEKHTLYGLGEYFQCSSEWTADLGFMAKIRTKGGEVVISSCDGNEGKYLKTRIRPVLAF